MSDIEKKNQFEHRVNKSSIPFCDIMGVRIAAINMEWLLNFTEKHIMELSGDYICVSNVHTTVMAHEDKQYCAVQNGGIMAIPDGGPLSSVGRKRGFPNMGRTTGPSYMEEILKRSGEKGWSHYFYGGTEDTLEKLAAVMQQKYPDVRIAGMYSPPFRPLTEEEKAQDILKINETAPDFVWIGLGAPKQEKWMAEHQGKIRGLMIGVGAAFDYLAGNIQRAPQWMQKWNLEWFFRLCQEPKRLFKRYLLTNTKFIFYVISGR